MNNYSKQIQAIQTIGQNLKKLPQEVISAEKNYKDFVDSMNKSDFCNTSRRYLGELAYVKRLQELYSKNNCTDLQTEMSERESVILEKLKCEFGITYNQ